MRDIPGGIDSGMYQNPRASGRKLLTPWHRHGSSNDTPEQLNGSVWMALSSAELISPAPNLYAWIRSHPKTCIRDLAMDGVCRWLRDRAKANAAEVFRKPLEDLAATSLKRGIGGVEDPTTNTREVLSIAVDSPQPGDEESADRDDDGGKKERMMGKPLGVPLNGALSGPSRSGDWVWNTELRAQEREEGIGRRWRRGAKEGQTGNDLLLSGT
ncbi:hypothetical protein B0H19DRAFT_1071235 [Mycena capillaripes]|nr:hypothetical protein B0H19DRAFT_1071235 [Mycena capillaripes]